MTRSDQRALRPTARRSGLIRSSSNAAGPVRHKPRGCERLEQGANLVGPLHVDERGDLDVFRTLRRPERVRIAHRDTRKRLRRIAIQPTELSPGAHVDAVVQIDRAPFVGPGPRVSPSTTTTRAPPVVTTRPVATTPAPTTTSSTPPNGLDTRPAVGMPGSPEGSSAFSNSGGPVTVSAPRAGSPGNRRADGRGTDGSIVPDGTMQRCDLNKLPAS